MKKLFGITIAMVTPFKASGEVDYEAVARLTEVLLARGVDCFYPCGTTGEMTHLTAEERKRIAETVVRTAAGRATVYIHCGAASQAETLELVKHAHQIGADGAGVVTPIFLGANAREMENYYLTLANSVPKDFPIYLYNIPQCAANDLSVDVAASLAEKTENIIGIKYSYADINRTIDYLRIKNGTFSVLHGCDRALIAMLALGCDGTVSGAAGVFPEPFVEVYRAFQERDLERARKAQKAAVEIVDILKAGANMSYFKKALKIRGIDAGVMRAPQLDIPEEETETLRAELAAYCKKYGYDLQLAAE